MENKERNKKRDELIKKEKKKKNRIERKKKKRKTVNERKSLQGIYISFFIAYLKKCSKFNKTKVGNNTVSNFSSSFRP